MASTEARGNGSSGRDASRDGSDPPAVDERVDADSLYLLRATIAAHAHHLGLAIPEVDAVLIVAGELASNVIRHGGGTGRLRLWRSGDRVYCEVSDRGPGLADLAAGTRRPELMAPGGRGLWICRNLAQLSVESSPRGTTVTASFPVDNVHKGQSD